MSFFDGIEEALDTKAAEEEELMSAEKWEPEEGEVLQGILLKANTPNTDFGRGLVLTVRNVGKTASGGVEPNKSAAVWAGTVLRRLLEDPDTGQPKVGKALVIRYEGMKEPKKGGNPFKMFTLIVEEQDPDYWDRLVHTVSGPEALARHQGQQSDETEPEGGWF